MRLLQVGGESGIRTHEGLHPTAFRERHFRPLRHLSEAEYSISPWVWQEPKLLTLYAQPSILNMAQITICHPQVTFAAAKALQASEEEYSLVLILKGRISQP